MRVASSHVNARVLPRLFARSRGRPRLALIVVDSSPLLLGVSSPPPRLSPPSSPPSSRPRGRRGRRVRIVHSPWTRARRSRPGAPSPRAGPLTPPRLACDARGPDWLRYGRFGRRPGRGRSRARAGGGAAGGRGGGVKGRRSSTHARLRGAGRELRSGSAARGGAGGGVRRVG